MNDFRFQIADLFLRKENLMISLISNDTVNHASVVITHIHNKKINNDNKTLGEGCPNSSLRCFWLEYGIAWPQNP